jgi:hypothetical protein
MSNSYDSRQVIWRVSEKLGGYLMVKLAWIIDHKNNAKH